MLLERVHCTMIGVLSLSVKASSYLYRDGANNITHTADIDFLRVRVWERGMYRVALQTMRANAPVKGRFRFKLPFRDFQSYNVRR